MVSWFSCETFTNILRLYQISGFLLHNISFGKIFSPNIRPNSAALLRGSDQNWPVKTHCQCNGRIFLAPSQFSSPTSRSRCLAATRLTGPPATGDSARRGGGVRLPAVPLSALDKATREAAPGRPLKTVWGSVPPSNRAVSTPDGQRGQENFFASCNL